MVIKGVIYCHFLHRNVVGYAQNQLRTGSTMLTPQFVNIGTEGMPLQSIVPVGDSIDTDGGIYIQILDSAGREVDNYQWIDWGEPAWCDSGYTPLEGVYIQPGQGLWITGISSSDGIQTAGQVGAEDVVVKLRQGSTPTGNPFPVAINLQDILPEGDSIDTDGGIYIQILDSAGREVDNYQWIDWGEPAWCDSGYTPLENVYIQPGQGLWITGVSTADYIRFPAPEL